MSADFVFNGLGNWGRLARRRPGRTLAAVIAGGLLVGSLAVWRSTAAAVSSITTVRTGSIVVRMTETGVLRPAEAITYRSPLGTRETEVIFLAPEGIRVNEGDLVVELDSRELDLELERTRQAKGQAELELQMTIAEREDAAAGLESLTVGERALEIEEAQSKLRLAERKTERLKGEVAGLKPLLDRGFITRDELEQSVLELEEAEAEIQLARRRVQLLLQQTYPREKQRASLRVTQQDVQLSQRRQRLADLTRTVEGLAAAIENCRLYARRPGLVVYEDYMASSPRRKIRHGDRVTASQGLVTIPEVAQMIVESSLREADVHLVKAGQRATVRVDAFPEVRLTGSVASVGALARRSEGGAPSEKRFELVVRVDPNDVDLRPEMTARLEIQVSQRESVPVIPVSAVFDRDGLFVVHVLHRWTTEVRLVELGASNELEVEVVKGLKEGDRISLTDAGASRRSPADQPAPSSGIAPSR